MYFFEKAELGKIYIDSIDAIFVVFNTYSCLFQGVLFLWKSHYLTPYEIGWPAPC